jgi:hypothetical protein
MHQSVRFARAVLVLLATAPVAFAQGVGPRKIAQIIGDYDFTLKLDTLTQTHSSAHIGGTDLGSSFVHKNRLYFLFGDTFSDNFPGPNGRDTLVYTTATNPWNVTFTFPFVNSNSQYHPITVPNTVQGFWGFCVPSGGVSYDDEMFMVYTNQWYEPPTGERKLSTSLRQRSREIIEQLRWSLELAG